MPPLEALIAILLPTVDAAGGNDAAILRHHKQVARLQRGAGGLFGGVYAPLPAHAAAAGLLLRQNGVVDGDDARDVPPLRESNHVIGYSCRVHASSCSQAAISCALRTSASFMEPVARVLTYSLILGSVPLGRTQNQWPPSSSKYSTSEGE